MPRFVFLHHQLPVGSQQVTHYDWMLEHDGRLLTWAINERPFDQVSSGSCTAIRLDDHRIEYLQYQGSISGNRGQVTRLIEGRYDWTEPILGGRVSSLIIRVEQKSWQVTFDPPIQIEFVANQANATIRWEPISQNR
jgi:hypothetical protein